MDLLKCLFEVFHHFQPKIFLMELLFISMKDEFLQTKDICKERTKNQNFYIGVIIKHHWSAFRRIIISYLMLNCRCYGCH